MATSINDTGKLRDILFSEIDDLRSGKSNPQRAQAVSKLAAQIVYSSRLEMEAKQLEYSFKLNCVPKTIPLKLNVLEL